jgi:5'-3' exonuclease
MGIQKLNKWIRWVSDDERVSWKSLSGKKIGIDALGFLYKANEDHVSDCLVVAKLIAFWRSHGIEPVFVFDGRIPPEKQRTCVKRRQYKDWLPVEKQVYVTSEDRNRVKQLLYACGVTFLNANEEADSVLAFLMRRGDIAAIVSQDMDFLARGCETLLVPTGENPETWRCLHLSNLLEASHMTYEEFLTMCVLLGSDYSPSIPSLPMETLMNRVKRETLTSLLAKEGVRNPSLWISAMCLLRGQKDTWESMLSEKQRDKWSLKQSPENEVLERMYETELLGFPEMDRKFLHQTCSIPSAVFS